MKKPPSFNRKQAAILSAFLDSPERHPDTMSYWECVGFLYVVTCSPEMVQPSEWLQIIFGDGGNGPALAANQEILGALMALYNELNRQVQGSDVALLPGCEFHEDPMANIHDNAPISQWASGFLQGYHWLEIMWSEHIPEELKKESSAQMVVLSFFGSAKVAQTCLEEATQDGVTIDTMAANMQSLFVDAMKSFAFLGYTIQQALLEHHVNANQPVQKVKVGRNEPCPCGSGKKYKKCCAVA